MPLGFGTGFLLALFPRFFQLFAFFGGKLAIFIGIEPLQNLLPLWLHLLLLRVLLIPNLRTLLHGLLALLPRFFHFFAFFG